MEYPNNLRFLRDAKKLNQKAIADLLNIHQAEYGRMENGKRRVGRHLEKLAEILTCTPADIISDGPSTSPTQIDMMPFYALPDGASGAIRFDMAMSTQVERPPVMRGRSNAFCLLCPTNNMEPALQPGDLCFADPDEPPRDDDLVVVSLQAGNRILCSIRKFLGAGVYASIAGDEEFEYGPELVNAAPIMSVIYAR